MTLSQWVEMAAFMDFPESGKLGKGLVPNLPEGIVNTEILPWLGFMLSGAVSLMWYFYWVPAAGKGAVALKDGEGSRLFSDGTCIPAGPRLVSVLYFSLLLSHPA